jgi:Leucine-rich repeat (LRR) protein
MNKKVNTANILVLCFFLIIQKVSAQDSDSSLFTKNFTNLNEALNNPDKVFRLDLSNQILNNAQIESIAKFKNLIFLNLKNDHLKEIPKSISVLSNLKILDLSGNDFKFLPTEIKKLKKLEEIYLNNDFNADINQEIRVLSKLPNLKILHLENDSIGILPKSINSLKKLEKLYLNNNNLTEFPEFLSKNKKLIFIDMKNNPLLWKGEKPFGITINF